MPSIAASAPARRSAPSSSTTSNEHVTEYPKFGQIVGAKELWYHIVSTDRDISTMLQKTMALSSSLIEINVAGEDGKILASSSERRVGESASQLRDFAQWNKGSARSRLLDLIRRGGPDYQVVVPLGYKGQDQRHPFHSGGHLDRAAARAAARPVARAGRGLRRIAAGGAGDHSGRLPTWPCDR